jgi:hypothetical protein
MEKTGIIGHNDRCFCYNWQRHVGNSGTKRADPGYLIGGTIWHKVRKKALAYQIRNIIYVRGQSLVPQAQIKIIHKIGSIHIVLSEYASVLEDLIVVSFL